MGLDTGLLFPSSLKENHCYDTPFCPFFRLKPAHLVFLQGHVSLAFHCSCHSHLFILTHQKCILFFPQDYNKRGPLVFVFCCTFWLSQIFIFFFISIKPGCKIRGARSRGELTAIQFCWGCKLDPSISLSRKTNKMPIL